MTQKLSNAMLFKNKLIEEQEGEALQTVVVDDYLQKEVNFLPEQSKSVLTSPQKSPQKPVSILSHTSSRGSPFQSPSKQSPSRNAHFQLEDSSQNAVSSPSRFKRSEEVIQIQNEIKQMQKEEAELQKENQFKLSQQQIAKNTGLIVNSVKNTSVGPFVTQKQIKQSQNSIIAKELEFFEKIKKDNEAIQNDEEYQQIRRIPQIRKQLSISPIRNQSRYQSKQSLTPRSKVFESRNNQSSQEEESANKIKIFQLQHSRFYFHEMQAAFKKIEQANNIIEEKELFIRKQSQAIISLEQEMAAFKESVPSTRADEVAKLNVQLQQANKQIQEKNLKIQKLIHEHIDLYKSNEPYSKRRAHQKADELYEDYQGQIKKVQKSFTDQQVRFVELESENNRLNQALAQKTHENDFIRKELGNLNNYRNKIILIR